MTGEITVAEALRFSRKLKALKSDGAQAIYVGAFARRVASRCAEIALETRTMPRSERRYHGDTWPEIVRCAYMECADAIRREFNVGDGGKP